jgi:hypothetical protein
MRPRSFALLTVLGSLLVIGGCSKKNPPNESTPAASATPSSPAAAPSGASGPSKPEGFDAKGKVDGKAVEYRSAVAFKHKGSAAIHIQASTEKVTCADVTSEEEPKLPEGADKVEIVVTPVLKADGGTAWTVMQAFHYTSKSTSSYAIGKYADASLAGSDPAKGMRVTVSGWNDKKASDFGLDGTIVAEGCGLVPGWPSDSDESLTPRPQSKLTLEVAGKKLDIVGAIHQVDRNMIVLSTRPVSCTASFAEVEATLRLADDGTSGRFDGLTVEEMDTQDLPKPVKVELGKPAGGSVTAKLAGDFKLGSYPVKLSGSADLLVCE